MSDIGLLNKENKIKATAINIFDGNVDISYVNPILHEILQNIFRELPPHLIISRCINYHGEILELEWETLNGKRTLAFIAASTSDMW